MAAGDLALRMLITADATGAAAAVGLVGTHLLGLSSLFPNLKNGLGNIAFGLRNLGTAGTIGMDALKQGAVQAGNAFFKLGLALASIGVVAALALGAIAVHAAGDFQQGLNRLVTGAGDVTDNMKLMGQAILGVSTDTGVMTGPLLSAMYQIISAGQRGAQAEDTLAAAAKGSVTEQANVVDVAKALTTAMTDYGTKTFNATQFMNGYTRATQLGKITLEQLSTSMGPILPLAQNLGIKFADVAGAMSTMTNAGIPAERAATSLRFLFQSLENPTHKASVAMQNFGLDSVKLANELKVSLPGALQMVYDAAKKAGPEGSVPFNRAVSDMIGGQRSLQAYLSLTGTHLKTFKDNTSAISTAMNGSKTGILGWQTALGNLNVQVDKGKAAFMALLITIGTALLPVITNLVSTITPLIVGFTTWLATGGRLQAVIGFISAAFSFLGNAIAKIVQIGVGIVTFFQQNEVAMDALKATLILAAIVIGVVLVAAFVSAAIAVWGFTIALLANPITWIIIAIIAVITGIILVITHWGQIMTWLGNVMGVIGAFIGNVFSAIGTTARNVATSIKNGVGGAFDWLGTKVHDALTGIKNFFGNIFSEIGTKVHDALIGIATFFINKWNDLTSFVKSIPGKIGQALGNLKDILLAPFKWLYDHNWYVKAAVDAIIKDITNVKNFVGGAFDWLGTHIHDAMTGIKNTVGGAFDWLGTHAHDFATGVKNTVGGAFDWLGTHVHGAMTGMKNSTGSLFDQIGTHARDFATGTKNFVGNAFSALGSIVHDKIMALAVFLYTKWEEIKSNVLSKVNGLKDSVGTAFSNLGSMVRDKITGLWNWITGFVSGWPSQAFQWGVNLIQGLINGIGNMFGNLKNMLGNIAGAIGNFLGFHSPTKEGPGREADRWAPNFIRMYVGGLRAGIPQVQSAFAALISPTTARGGSNAFALGGGSSAGAGGGYGVMNLQIKLDTHVIGEAVGVHMAKEVRINGRRNS